jgi:hypothetical protein
MIPIARAELALRERGDTAPLRHALRRVPEALAKECGALAGTGRRPNAEVGRVALFNRAVRLGSYW